MTIYERKDWNMEFTDDNRIKIEPPTRTKKLTATRFAAVMGLNRWQTPFATWCEMTKVYCDPFEESKYTLAGKIIEPKIAEYLKTRYFFDDLKSPTDVYGVDYFDKTHGDFFPYEKVFGGMWDFIGKDYIVEVKTTKRAEDWLDANGKPNPPVYYKLQAALYAHLLGFEHVVMVCSFLNESDYPVELANGEFDTAPTDAFEPTIDNTIVYEFELSEELPNFDRYVAAANDFWREHVETGISPVFDPKADADIVKSLRSQVIETPDELKGALEELDRLSDELESFAPTQKRVKELKEMCRKYLSGSIADDCDRVSTETKERTWTLSRSVKEEFDKRAFEKAYPELYKQFVTTKSVLTLREKKN